MLFKILKLFGLDVPAKVDAAKAVIEQRAAEVADRAKLAALSAALIIALSTFAAPFLTMAIGVGLMGLYHAEATAYGMDGALAIVATVLVAVALSLLMLGKSLSGKHAPELRNDVTSPAVAAAPLARVPSPEVLEPAVSAGDLIEPLAFLLPKYVKFPVLDHPVLNGIVEKLRLTARGTTDEAVERAANIVRYGDRGQLFMLLGVAAVAGWLLARQRSDERLHEVMPAG
jgi:hypothetical protein